MDWYEIEVNGKSTVKFSEKILPWSNQASGSSADYKLGGIIKDGEWAWLACNRKLQIVSLRSGQTVSSYEFAESIGFENYCIRCVAEIVDNNFGVLLAVCLDNIRTNADNKSILAVYSIEQNDVLKSVALHFHVTCACYMPPLVCRRSLLQHFDGCIALGSDGGVMVLLNLNLNKLLSPLNLEFKEDEMLEECRIINYTLPLSEIRRHFKECLKEQLHFGIQMEVIDSTSCVQSILPINLIVGLAVGLADGKFVIYDLTELQIFYIGLPHPQQDQSPLVKMDFLEPPDDPRSCIYIWTMHEGQNDLTAVLHTLMYQNRITDKDGYDYFEGFQSGSMRLQLPLESTKCVAVSCQSIYKISLCGDDDTCCLCALTWYSEIEEKNKILIFDLNQWYKEEMPLTLHKRKCHSYLAGYILSGIDCSLYSYINPKTVAHFNSIQRCEEHFYPNSLSFDCLLLLPTGCRSYIWEGIQNKVITLLRCSNASIFLEQDLYFDEIIHTRLLPQFCELNASATFSMKQKYFVILSVALENNCFNLLRDCAKCWSDGSFMGSLTAATGLSLSLLIEWIWDRATCIKVRCNDLCKGLFDFGGYPLDSREQKELGIVTRQLKLLADLLEIIVTLSKGNISENVFADIKKKHKYLRVAAEYHDVLLWLFNIGLLPEASLFGKKVNTNAELIPYPYAKLKDIYSKKRIFFSKISNSFISKKTGSCRLLFIDSFIEHECKGNMLREFWSDNNGDGLYPPTSIECMLRLLLITELDFDKKCAILLYFFLDLNMTIDEEGYKDVVANFIKFPSVFKLSASLIKTVETFWNLDHGLFLPAVNEFISPFNNYQNYPQWMVELLIETLLAQNSHSLALRILSSHPTLVSSTIRLKTLLSNDLISEAFHFARSKNDDLMLEFFFTCCLCSGKYGVIRDLALNEHEGQIIQSLLKRNKTDCAESLNFVYLLQKSKYIEAVSYMDEISKTKYPSSNMDMSYIDTPNLVSAYNTTITPVTQGLTDVFFRIRNKIKKKDIVNDSPVPLSCQLIKQNANNLLGGIYHSSALSAHFATYYWGEMYSDKNHDATALMSSNNAPFLRKPQSFDTLYRDQMEDNIISYPQIYKATAKRTLAESEIQENIEGFCRSTSTVTNPKKKRRLIGQEFLNELSQFKEKNMDTRCFDSKSTFGTEIVSESFFTKPVIKIQNEQVSMDVKSTEIHGILKSNTAEINEPLGSHKELSTEEEKNIRFRLPHSDNKNDVDIEKSEVENIQPNYKNKNYDVAVSTTNRRKVEVTECIEIDMQCDDQTSAGSTSSHNEEENSYQTQNMQKQDTNKLFNSKIEESEVNSFSISQDATDTESQSEETFFSPLSSKNTSINLTNLDSSTYPTNRTQLSNLGPKARKSITRSPVKFSNVFISPEPLHKPSNKNSTENTKINTDFNTPKKIAKSRGDSDENSVLIPSSATQLSSTSLCFLGSKINEFVPKISSSKVCETQSKFSQVKLSECTTVIGSLTQMESTIGTNITYEHTSETNQQKNKISNKDNPDAYKMLDTTLDMSSYDFTVLETTPIQQGKRDTEVNKNKHFDLDEKNNLILMEIKDNNNSNSRSLEEECSVESNIIVTSKIQPDSDVIELSSSNDASEHFANINNEYYFSESNSDIDSNNDNETSIGNTSSDSDIIKVDDEMKNQFEIEIESSSDTSTEEEKKYELDDESDELEVIDIQTETTGLNENEGTENRMASEIEINNTESKKDIDLEIYTENQITLHKEPNFMKSIEESDKSENITDFSEVTQNNSQVVLGQKDGSVDNFDVSNKIVKKAETQSKKFDLIQSMPLKIESVTSTYDGSPIMDVLNTKSDQSKTVDSKVKFGENIWVSNPSCSALKIIAVCSSNDTEINLQNSYDVEKSVDLEEKSEQSNFKTIVTANEEILSQSQEPLNVVLQENKKNDEEINNINKNDDGLVLNVYAKELIESTCEINTDSTKICDTESLNKEQENIKTSNANANENEKSINSSPVLIDVLSYKKNRQKRGISVPPQHNFSETEEIILTPCTRRSKRAASLQPMSKLDEDVNSPTLERKTSRTRRNSQSTPKTLPDDKVEKDSTLLPGSSKLSTRRRSLILDSISEDKSVLDSPSSNTRSRARFNSIDSELDNSFASGEHSSLKRTRASSVISNLSDSSPYTPKKTRRSSISSQGDLGTPKSTRAYTASKRRASVDEKLETKFLPQNLDIVKGHENVILSSKETEKVSSKYSSVDNKTSPKTEVSPTNYATSRRLTRAQLAMLEKSSAILSSPTTSKRISKRATSRSSANTNRDSDDADSISSHFSNISSKTGPTRRVTRSSVKDKDEIDDELISNASSSRSKRSKARTKEKNSPIVHLNTIPEDESESDHKKRKNFGK